MSFTPVLPFTGYTGWKFLDRTLTQQKTAFEKDPAALRDEAYFRAKIGSIRKPEDLVADRRLLSIALGAFGLDNDLPNKAFIKKILAEGSLDPKSLGNRLADKQYLAMASAFGFDLKPPRTVVSGFADKIITPWKTRRFEAAVGDQNNDMRLALNAQRELQAIAKKAGSDDTRWFNIIGNPPLRNVFLTALGLPSSFSGLDVDKQVKVLRERTENLLGQGEISQFKDAAQTEKLIRIFLVRSDLQNSDPAARSPALQLLGGGLSLRL